MRVRWKTAPPTVLLVLASLLWWHRWVPPLLVAAFVSWAILHTRFEGEPGAGLRRLWRRAWPPGPLALIPLLCATTLAYWRPEGPMAPRLLPISLNMLALSMILFGNWWSLSREKEKEIHEYARA